MFDDVQGRPFPLFTLVTETIRYLKDELINNCKRNVPEFKDTDILWVLTVPAIWSDSARNFMREAAENVSTLVLQRKNFREYRATAKYHYKA